MRIIRRHCHFPPEADNVGLQMSISEQSSIALLAVRVLVAALFWVGGLKSELHIDHRCYGLRRPGGTNTSDSCAPSHKQFCSRCPKTCSMRRERVVRETDLAGISARP
jgi:hypothetical protein